MAAIVRANDGHALAYGADALTERATGRFRDLLGTDVGVSFAWGGTGANIVGLQCLLAPWEAVLCPESSHIVVDECGAAERIIGCKLIDVPTTDGKLRLEQITDHLHGQGDEHHVQVKVVSVTQSTEMGTLYTADEIGALADTCHANGLLLHVDGARIANAVAALGTDLRSLVVDTAVDVLTFGGTKNGLMYGEAVLFLRPELGAHAKFVRKQAAQLPSKMRFIAAQYDALLTDDLWLRNGAHANAMAQRLADAVDGIDGVELLRRPAVNAVFAKVPAKAIAPLQDWSFFWIWDAAASEVRWMCSFDTTEDDVDRFAAGVGDVLADLGASTGVGPGE
jgi:threonine aldolase